MGLRLGGAPAAGTSPAVTAALAAAARRRMGLPGRIVWIVDDNQAGQRTYAAPRIEAVGGRMNFALSSDFVGLSGNQMNAAQTLDIYNRGHQIMCHSKTHP